MPFLSTWGFCYRHEIAFVFGQLSSPDSVPSLIDVLSREHEQDMVRHEAAEALGGIATDECFPILKEYSKRMDVPRVVRESCEVALDMVCSPLQLSRSRFVVYADFGSLWIAF